MEGVNFQVHSETEFSSPGTHAGSSSYKFGEVSGKGRYQRIVSYSIYHRINVIVEQHG